MITEIYLFSLVLTGGADTTVRLQSCGRPEEMLGVLPHSGEADFQIDRRGRVKKESIRVITVAGGSSAGFLSALRRQLTSCRFEPAGTADVWVRGNLAFRGETLQVVSAETIGAPGAGLTDSAPPALAEVYDLTSPELDELPRVVPCSFVPREEITVRRRINGQMVEPQTPPISVPSRMVPGRVSLSYIIKANGLVQENSFQAPGDSDPRVLAQAVMRIQNCKYVPGRVMGRRVAVRVASIEQF
jgi:hypothetical protein